MKTKLTTMLIFVIALIPVSIGAFQNEPDNFRGIKWGADLGKLPEFKEVKKQTYEKKHEKMKIGDADLDKVLYVARKDEFYAVMIFYNNPINYLILKEVLFGVYGEVEQVCPLRELEIYLWHGKNVNIEYNYNYKTNKGSIRYTYLPVSEKVSLDREQRDREAAGDL